MTELFKTIDWDEPFSLQKEMRLIPESAVVKSFYARNLLARMQKIDKRMDFDKRILHNETCPLREYMSLLADASHAIYPHLGIRLALKNLGLLVFPAFANSVAGGIILSVAGNNAENVMRLANKAAASSMTFGTAQTLETSPTKGIVRLKGVYYSDSYQVGVMEGMLCALEKKSIVTSMNRLAEDEVTLKFSWIN